MKLSARADTLLSSQVLEALMQAGFRFLGLSAWVFWTLSKCPEASE